MKKYIFVTYPITYAGGVQCYVAAKAKYLESQGWSVNVLFASVESKKGINPLLDKYLKDGVMALYRPSYYPDYLIKKHLDKICKTVGPKEDFDEIIIESHNCEMSIWGELIAEKYNARHYIYLVNEHYRGKNKCYEKYIDFFLFKFQRKEILGELQTFNRLFEGYREVKTSDFPGEVVIDEAPIQDIPSPKVADLAKKEWNICYIGRGMKPYVENILTQVGDFAGLYPEKEIQLVTVGDMDCRRDVINQVMSEHNNLSITELGMMFPLPLMLYEKVDVVIAGSGSARHSAEIGAITIVADSETLQSDGILGFETLNSVYASSDSVCTSFTDALKRVLVDKVYLKMENKFPKRKGVEWCTKQNFELFAHSEREKIYYSYDKLTGGEKHLGLILKNYISHLLNVISGKKK